MPLSLWLYENAILRCRSVTAALLRVKRVTVLDYRWDQFLLVHIARHVWATRCDERWRGQEEEQDRQAHMDDESKIKKKLREIDDIKTRQRWRLENAIERKRPRFFEEEDE